MSLSDQDDESAAMAAAMGFSSFGAGNPAKKKRKFNPATDAFVAGQELNAIDRGGKKGKGSGGNTVALGKVRTFGATIGMTKTRLNEGEIDLGDEEEEEEGGYAESRKTNLDSTTAGDQDSDSNDGPNYMDSSRPPPAAIAAQSHPQTDEDKEMQARIDAILASAPPPPPGSNEEISNPQDTEAQGRHPHSLPQRLPLLPAGGGAYIDTAFTQSRFDPTTGTRGRGGGRGRDGRERNERWYEGYYDPSFNENPWEQLEKEKGLHPVGNWLDRGHWTAERRKIESG